MSNTTWVTIALMSMAVVFLFILAGCASEEPATTVFNEVIRGGSIIRICPSPDEKVMSYQGHMWMIKTWSSQAYVLADDDRIVDEVCPIFGQAK